jgi:hypothetical protein
MMTEDTFDGLFDVINNYVASRAGALSNTNFLRIKDNL